MRGDVRGGSFNSYPSRMCRAVSDGYELYSGGSTKKLKKYNVGKCLWCKQDIISSTKNPKKFCCHSHSSLYHHRKGTFKGVNRIKCKTKPNKELISQMLEELETIPMVIYD